MIISYLSVIFCCLLVVSLLGLVRIIISCDKTDYILAVQLLSTGGVALFVLLAVIQQHEAMLNGALVLAVLAPLMLLAFIYAVKRQR